MVSGCARIVQGARLPRSEDKDMQLSEGERLILVMLADITKALGLNGSVDPDLVRRLVSGEIVGR